MNNIIELARTEFARVVRDNGSDPYQLTSHIHELEKWAEFMLSRYPEANRGVVMLSVFLHDIGHYPINKDEDHAVTSERVGKTLLEKWGLDKRDMERVLHCVRAHRCKDVPPNTIEARIVACIDSASHMTDSLYLDMCRQGKVDGALLKLERDYRDVALFPEVKDMLAGMYSAWKNLLHEYKKINLNP